LKAYHIQGQNNKPAAAGLSTIPVNSFQIDQFIYEKKVPKSYFLPFLAGFFAVFLAGFFFVGIVTSFRRE